MLFIIAIAAVTLSLTIVGHFTIKCERNYINDLDRQDREALESTYVSSNAHREYF